MIAAKATIVPAAYDARTKIPGMVAAQGLNQGQCGSCYAFASMTSYSYRLAIATNGKHNMHISPASASACTNGCNGGSYYYVAQAMNAKGGFGSLECDPYTQASARNSGHQCNVGLPDACVTSGVTSLKYKAANFGSISGSYYTQNGDIALRTIDQMETLIMAEVAANGPAYIQIHAGSDLIRSRSYNILALPASTDLNHAVVVLGWGTEAVDGAPLKYWIVQVCMLTLFTLCVSKLYTVSFSSVNCFLKCVYVVQNSWGNSWGEDGFGRIKRGVNAGGMELGSC